MKVLDRYDYIRRDCKCDLECENCGEKETKVSAYDDNNFWVNVIPNRKCKNCGFSTKEMGKMAEEVQTKYKGNERV